MINYNELTEVNSKDFLFKAFEYNLNLYQNYKDSSFYIYTEGLSKFGGMININLKLKIYKRIQDEKVYYYAIDKTGLSHGYINGPLNENQKLGTNLNSRIEYFGYGRTYDYDCVIDMIDSNKIVTEPVNLKILRERFLPILKESDEYPFRYFRPSGYQSFYSIIYRSNTRSFYLPICELIFEKLHLKCFLVGPVKLEENYISIVFEHFWTTRKRDNWKIWKGKISYQNFDIFDIILIEEDSKSNW